MPDFGAAGTTLTLRPGATDVPVSWRFTACTSASANDGALPYGTTIASAAVAIYDPGDVAVAGMVESVVVSGGLVVTATLTHPGAVTHTTARLYTAVLTLTLSTGAKLVVEAKRLNVVPPRS